MSDLRRLSAAWLGPLARSVPLSPNALTTIALLCNLAAAGALASAARWHPGFSLAILLAGVGGLLDILDGVVARAKNLTSRWGDFLDHFFDRVSDLALLGGWILGARVEPWIGLVALSAVALVGYAGTQLEASFGGREYESTGRAEYFVAVLGLPMIAWLGGDRVRSLVVAGLPLFDLLTLVIALGAVFGILQRLREARRRASAASPSP